MTIQDFMTVREYLVSTNDHVVDPDIQIDAGFARLMREYLDDRCFPMDDTASEPEWAIDDLESACEQIREEIREYDQV